MGYPTIDVSTIQERNPIKMQQSGIQGGNNGGTMLLRCFEHQQGAKEGGFQKAWDEAHVKFKEKMKDKEKMSIDIDE